jgi:hypothetical protein
MSNILNNEGNSLEQWSLLRLLQLAWIGSLLIASQFLWVPLHEGFIRLHAHFFGPRLSLFANASSILLLLAPILIGTVLITLSYWWLSDGLTRIKWTESEIEAAHLWVQSHDLNRTAKWLLWSFVFVEIVMSYVVFHVWKIAHHTSTKLFFDSLTVLCIPSLVVSSIGDRLRQDAPTPTPSVGGGRRHQRFHSEHWGER